MINNNKIKPVHGKVYYLCTDQFHGMFSGCKSFYGLYIGFNPIETKWFSRIERPEGHTFVRQNKDEKLEVYCTRSSGDLKMRYLCDGDDDPAYSVGIHTGKVDYEFSKEEKEYFMERLKVKQVNGELKNVA